MPPDQIASNFSKLFDHITDMIEDIALLMPQFEIYNTLFPGKKALDICIQTLINDFAGFCIDTVIFFQRSYFSELTSSLGQLLAYRRLG